MKYIDANKLIAEIKHLQEKFPVATYEALYHLITSLQQEQSEVDLEEEVHRFFEECIEVHEVPLYGKVKERVISVGCYEMAAYHFYKLGLNARKEDEK